MALFEGNATHTLFLRISPQYSMLCLVFSHFLARGINPQPFTAHSGAFELVLGVQVHQPQRFSTMLWKLCAALEAQLGCLVGCNAYITPADAQGLAPHWDDVSIFVLQTAGTQIYPSLPAPFGAIRCY